MLTALLLAAWTGSAPAQEKPRKIELGVLYAGVVDAPRTADFKEFLGEHFTKFGTVALESLDQKAAAGYDVVIVDSPTPYRDGAAEGFEMPKAPTLDLDFTRPTILMGAAGGRTLGPLSIKLGWL
jgi:hypothetical protein